MRLRSRGSGLAHFDFAPLISDVRLGAITLFALRRVHARLLCAPPLSCPPSSASPVLHAPFFPDFLRSFLASFRSTRDEHLALSAPRCCPLLRALLPCCALSLVPAAPALPRRVLPCLRVVLSCVRRAIFPSVQRAPSTIHRRSRCVRLRFSRSLSPFTQPVRVSPPRPSSSSDCCATCCTPLHPLSVRALSASAAFLRVVHTSSLLPVLVAVRAPPPSHRCPALSSPCAVFSSSSR